MFYIFVWIFSATLHGKLAPTCNHLSLPPLNILIFSPSVTLTLAGSQSSLSLAYLSLSNNTRPQILSLSHSPAPPFRSLLLDPSKRIVSFFISSFAELKHDNLKQWRLVENPIDPESLWLCYGLNHLLLPRQALVRWVPAAPLLHHNASSPFHRLPLTQSK